MDKRLRRFDSDGEAFEEAFRLFLAHTDQKSVAKKWLGNFADNLSRRRVFIDLGAGDGTLTSFLRDRFVRTIATEPNPKLSAKLKALGGIEVLEAKLNAIDELPRADLILCSHVFYLLDPSTWLATIEKLAGWVEEGGALIIINQRKDTDCRKMVAHFYGVSRDLSEIFDKVKRLGELGYRVGVETIPAFIHAPDLSTAYRIAEFVLNGSQPGPGPLVSAVEQYLKENFLDATGTFRFSCHQECLIVQKRPSN